MARDWIKKNYDYLLLVLVLIVGSLLRFHNLSEISFSNDELSALTRARFATFHALIEQGIKTDGHPALVEALIWFIIHHFNDSVLTVRFLFALSGIISIALIFLLAKQWFGKTAAILSAAALATLEFPLLYSQLARPYSIGLMFTLATAYFWTQLLFENQKDSNEGSQNKVWQTKRNQFNSSILPATFYILCASAAMYTHYFSLLMIVMMAVSGLFFLRKENYKRYLLCNIIVALLFIPHLSITKFQFAYGGLGWLSAPKSNFLSLFIHYGFNDSNIVFYLFAGILLLSAIIYSRRYKWKKFHSLCIAWYFIPFLIGYYYSTHKAPILQYSVLFFSFPFLLIFTFSFIKEAWLSNKYLVTLVTLIILATGAYSTISENKYYTINHFGVFKELAQKVVEWNNKFGKENITSAFTLSDPEYINYYFRKLNHEPAVVYYSNDEKPTLGKLSSELDSCKTEYFAYGWTNWDHQYETLELIRERYPVVADRDTFFNSEITLFKRGNTLPAVRLISATNFEIDNWDKETEKQNRDIAHSGNFSQKMNDKTEYSATFRSSTEKIYSKAAEMLKTEVWFNAPDSVGNAALVVAFSKNGETISWQSMPLKYYYVERNKWQRIIFCVPIVNEPQSELAVYVWNPDKKSFYIDDFKITVSERSPYYRPL